MYALSRASMLGSSSATSTKVSSFFGGMILLSGRRRIRNQVRLTVKVCVVDVATASSAHAGESRPEAPVERHRALEVKTAGDHPAHPPRGRDVAPQRVFASLP